ncbi:MAG: hypothetical protein VZQ98_07170 [Bacteroidales bacterium]|nr:hypothetical protein [Bacteroidales bacterium]
MMKRILFFFFFCTFTLYACEEDTLHMTNVVEANNFQDYESSQKGESVGGKTAVLQRAKKISTITWTPLAPIYSHKLNGYFEANHSYVGVPYSSVKQLDKFVGQEVSFETFLSAVNNPYSVLYTENMGASPYFGTNCSTYYGSVCSATVNYALNIKLPMTTSMYEASGLFERIPVQNISKAETGDIILKKNIHVLMVLDVKKSETDTDILLLESGDEITKEYTVSKSLYEKKFPYSDWIIYRYKKIDGVEYDLSEENNLEKLKTICMSRGDKSCYRLNENIEVSVLCTDYQYLVVENKDSVIYSTKIESKGNVSIPITKPGKYTAYLSHKELGGEYEESTTFEVIETNVSCARSGRYLSVDFSSSNGMPAYVVVCKNGKGDRSCVYVITDVDRCLGHVDIHLSDGSGKYCKVFFQGEYGLVSNVPIEI